MLVFFVLFNKANN